MARAWFFLQQPLELVPMVEDLEVCLRVDLLHAEFFWGDCGRDKSDITLEEADLVQRLFVSVVVVDTVDIK